MSKVPIRTAATIKTTAVVAATPPPTACHFVSSLSSSMIGAKNNGVSTTHTTIPDHNTADAAVPVVVVAAINRTGQSNVLHLLGAPFTRAFRCLWMLEEINQEYYDHNNYNNDNNNNNANHHSQHLQGAPPPPKFVQVPYYYVFDAKPVSSYVQQFHSTGKVPLLIEYPYIVPTNDINQVSSQQQQQDDTFVLSESSAINTYLYDQYGYNYNTNNGSNKGAEQHQQQQQSEPLVPPIGTRLRGQYDSITSCINMELDAQALWIHRKHNGDKLSLFLRYAGGGGDKTKDGSNVVEASSPNIDAIQVAQHQFYRINTYLASLLHPYLLGTHFTAVDILYMNCLEWSIMIGWGIDNPNNDSMDQNSHGTTTVKIKHYMELCKSRPAYQRAVQIRQQTKMNYQKTAGSSSTTGNNSGNNKMSKL